MKKYYETSNKSETCRLFKEQFDRVTKRDTVSKIVDRFEETGSVDELPRSGRPTIACSPENTRVVQAAFTESPTKSTRRASLELGISRTSIRRMLHSLGLHPYHPHLVHAMSEDDPDRRIEFCETFIDKCDHDLRFAEKIFWSDEAIFKMNGHVNRHNAIYWDSQNPHVEIERNISVEGVTVWAAICADGIIESFFFYQNVTGHSYVNMLMNNFPSRIIVARH